MSDRDFQDKVIGDLSALRTSTASMERHLERLNGKVAEHERRLNQQEDPDALESRLKVLESYKVAQEVANSVDSKWQNRLAPFAYGILALLAVLALINSDKVVQMLLH